MTSAVEFAEFARSRLPQSFADRWISLLRPAVVFPEEPVAPERPGLLHGGDPLLPEHLEWPMFEGRIPMSFIAEIDCAALAAAGGLELMPENGHLLFFCLDYGFEAGAQNGNWWEGVTPWTAGKVLYLPEGVARRARRTPEGLEALEAEERAARAASTPPSLDFDWAERYFGPEAPALIERHMQSARCGRKPSAADTYPLWAEGFGADLHGLRCFLQSGGHSYAIQQPLELSAAHCAQQRDGVPDPDQNAVLDEAEHWRLLLQDVVDEWGVMIGYWLIRDDDLAAGRFDRVYFEMQH